MIRLDPLARPAARVLPLALSAFLLAGCMTPSPYAPRLEGQQTGYTDRAITQNRYRVTFTGKPNWVRVTKSPIIMVKPPSLIPPVFVPRQSLHAASARGRIVTNRERNLALNTVAPPFSI